METATVNISIVPVATFSYAGPYCQSATNPSPTFTGVGSAGTFSSTAGLVFVSASSGEIDLAASTAGTYTVTNTIAASGGCAAAIANASIKINPSQNALFNYSGSTFCQSGTNPTPTIIGAPGGIFTASPAGLSINASTGTITLSSSSLGTFTVTYTTTGACLGSTTATVTISNAPVATFSYAGPYCQNGTDPSPIFSSGGTAGVFSSTPGLVFVNANSGEIDLSASTAGAYTVTNTIAAIGGCPASSSTDLVQIIAIPILTVTSDSICQGQTASLYASGASSYQWSTGDVTPGISVSPSTNTTYSVTGSNSGCISTAICNVIVSPVPIPIVSANVTITFGSSTLLFVSGGTNYLWTPSVGLSCTNCPNPIASPLITTTYCVKVINGGICRDSAFVTVTVNEIKCDDIFVPNAFSPNGDDMNELECILGSCIAKMEFAIFDRWGEKVFESTDPANCWDGMYRGKPMNTAGFVYYLKATLITGEKISKKGNINLIR